MTGELDSRIAERISAYLDGALPEAEGQELEALIASDADLAAEVAALRSVDAALAKGFGAMLNDPVPLHLARAIDSAPAGPAAVAPARRRPVSQRSMAAAVAFMALGAVLGALVTRAVAPPVVVAEDRPGWLEQVAEYHAVYAAQGRHLVEVPASEQAHLETWLSEQTGVAFRVPDLAASGLAFQGARLLVADGRPVAQLMYRDAEGQVIAVCFMASGEAAPAGEAMAFTDRRIGRFDLVSWRDQSADYVVIGPAGHAGLRQFAETAAAEL
jgi:anti-sigma factor RsiW